MNTQKSLKEIKKAKAEAAKKELRKACENFAEKKFTKEQLAKWSNEHKGLWFLPMKDDDGEIIALGIFKKITRSILSFAMTKIEEEGMMEFLEAAMRDCWIGGDDCILEDDDYFIPASQKFHKIMNVYQASLIKR